jgi:L-malate glycosyltransferase
LTYTRALVLQSISCEVPYDSKISSDSVPMICRFLYIVGQLGAGGLERQLCYLLQAMDRRRYLPGVAVLNFQEDDIYASRIRALGVPLYPVPSLSSIAAKLQALWYLVKQLKPEVVHSYSAYTNFGAWWATLGSRSIPVGAVRGDFRQEKSGFTRRFGAINFRWPRTQIYNSFSAAEEAKRSKSLFVPQQIVVVSNGLDLRRFTMAPLSTNGRAEVVGIGSLLPLKRWDRLTKAALEIKHRGLECRIRIAGNGPLRRSLEQEAQDNGLANQIILIGHYDDIPGLLARASFLVHTSDSEGCPNAVMEAMACGRAVIAMDAGDVPLLVEDGKTGFVVRCGDDKRLVECMATLIANRQLCRRMGEAGRAKAEREFGLDRLVSDTFAAYRAAGWEDV